MSQQNVDVVLDQFAATNAREFARAMDLYTEDVELVVDHEAFLRGGTFTGREAVGAWFADWLTTFEPGYRFEIVEVRDLGNLVFLDAAHGGRGRTSGIEVTGRTGYLYTVRDGRIARAELYTTPADALAAAAARE